MSVLSNAVHNERVKLTATFLNGLAVALFAVGGLAPTISIAAGHATPIQIPTLLGFAAFCYIFPGVLHLVARRALKGLRDDDG